MRPFRFGIHSSSLPPNGWIEWLKQLREDTGINYIVIQARDIGLIEAFANSVGKPLTQDT